MNSPILLYVVLLLALVLTLVGATLASRSGIIQLRRIGAYNAMPLTVSEAVESDRTLHVSYGSSGIAGASAISAVAISEVLYPLAERAALADRGALVTTSDPVTLALGQDTLRRAYKVRRALAKYRPAMARWYAQGPLSMAFAAGVGAAILEEDVSTNILLGQFGAELAIMAENAIRYDRFVIAQSDRIEGQAVAYVLSDTPLIGEELYAAGAYLGRRPVQIGGVLAQDIIRILITLLILALMFLAIAGAKF
ncbi:MAG TPA: DUF6754 domain-containing protein [Aggregatilineales bacterium]|nr:DUF6754 domain-containing protein [Aggregatilineales bacterium]